MSDDTRASTPSPAPPDTDVTAHEPSTRNTELGSATAALRAGGVADDGRPPLRRRGRRALATALILLGALLLPSALVATWAQPTLSDSDAFAAAYGPLIRDVRVQTLLTDQVVEAIDQRIDVDAVVGEVMDALTGAVVTPRPQAALELLRQPAVEGIRSSIRSATETVITSEGLAVAWEETLRVSHSQAVAILSVDPDVIVTGTHEGLGLRLSPIIEMVKTSLVQRGFALAERIPVIDKTIVIVPAEWLPQAQFAYGAAIALGYWLPLLTLALLVGGILVSAHRSRATVWAAVGVGIAALVVLGSIAAGGAVVAAGMLPAVSPQVASLFFATASSGLADLSWAVLVLAAVVGVAAWLGGSSRSAVGLRDGYGRVRSSLRLALEKLGFTTGRLGEWLFAQRVAMRVVVGLGGAGFLLLNRPLTLGVILGTAAVVLLVLLMLSLAERPTARSIPESK